MKASIETARTAADHYRAQHNALAPALDEARAELAALEGAAPPSPHAPGPNASPAELAAVRRKNRAVEAHKRALKAARARVEEIRAAQSSLFGLVVTWEHRARLLEAHANRRVKAHNGAEARAVRALAMEALRWKP